MIKNLLTLGTPILVPNLLYYLLSIVLFFLRTLGAIFGTTLETALNTGGVQCTADDVISNTRKVLHTTAAHEHDGVFLKVVTLARNVGVHLLLVL